MPELTREQALSKLWKVMEQLDGIEELKKIVDAKKEVLARFQPIFSREHIPQLTEQEFHDFLLFKNNRHWSVLHKNVAKNCENMPLLRNALLELVNEEQPIESRFDQAVNIVPGMGKAITTAILLIAYPDKYGVWNRISEGGLKALDLWPNFDRGISIGKRYSEINKILLQLAKELNTDLWTLDALWWNLQPEPIERIEVEEDSLPSLDNHGQTIGFGKEICLQAFLEANWDQVSLRKEWKVYSEDGGDAAGFQYPCGVGYIDILARSTNGKDWLVIELKRDKTSDATVGQVLRYMGWVKKKMAQPGEEVKGLIIARQTDESLLYALNATKDVDLQLYEVEFRLRPGPRVN